MGLLEEESCGTQFWTPICSLLLSFHHILFRPLPAHALPSPGSSTSFSLLQHFVVLALLSPLLAGRVFDRGYLCSAKMIIEYRIPMPLTVDEFHRGQLHMVAEKSLEVGEGAADEGVEWMRNEPYDNTGELLARVASRHASASVLSSVPHCEVAIRVSCFGLFMLLLPPADGHWGKSPITGVVVPRNKGQYTLKRYHIKSKLPGVGACSQCSIAPAACAPTTAARW